MSIRWVWLVEAIDPTAEEKKQEKDIETEWEEKERDRDG